MRNYLYLFLLFILVPVSVNAAYSTRPIEACSALLVEPDSFVRQLNEKSSVEDYMAETLLEVRRHPTFAAIDPARLLILQSLGSEPPIIWVFPKHTTAAQGLSDGLNDRHGSNDGRYHRFEPPLEYSFSQLQEASPIGRLVWIPGLASDAFLTSDGRSIRPNLSHVSFDFLEVLRRRLDSKQLILAFGKLIDRAEPVLRNVYNRNYYYLLGELLIDDRLLEVLDPDRVVKVINDGYPYFVFPGIKTGPFFGFVWHSKSWTSLIADANTGSLIELDQFRKSGDTFKLPSVSRQKLITYLASKSIDPKLAQLELADVDADTDVFDLQRRFFPALGAYQHLLQVLSHNGLTFAK